MGKIPAFTIMILFVFSSSLTAQKSIVETRDLFSIIAQADTGKKSIEEELGDLKKEMEELRERVADLEKAESEKNRLKLSGFFDVNASNYKNKPNVFEIGSLELQLEHNYRENFQVAAALVFSDGAELDVGFIDYHLFGGEISPRGRLFREKGVHLQVGKFDVPFGNDWQFFTAINRITINPPLTTSEIMEGGYNDAGARLLANVIFMNISLYALRGIEKGYSYGGNSYGGRIGFTPFTNPYSVRIKSIPVFELGGSYIHDVDRGGETTEKLAAADFQSKFGPLILRSEYYRRDKTLGILLQGYHVTVGIDLNPFPVIIYSRYSTFTSERYKRGDDRYKLTRATGGLNINLYNISYIKLEYLQYLDVYKEFEQDEYYSEKLYYIQLMIAF